jgi:hypothetical protein
VLTGLIVDAEGFDAGFLFLSGIAVLAACLFAMRVPETLLAGTDSAEA